MLEMILMSLGVIPARVSLIHGRFTACLAYALAFMFIASAPVSAQVTKNPGKIGVGLNYPGLGARALFFEKYMAEVRGQYEREAQAAGARLYRYVFQDGRYFPYLGLEADWVRFDDEGVKADGFAGEIFAGIECFIRPKLSFQFDVGPAYIGLKEEVLSVDGIQFVVNFGLTYYLVK